MGAKDYQVSGDHYKQGIQPWEIIEANKLDFWEGNALKYLLRWRKKDGIADLDKCIHYLQYLKEREESKNAIKYHWFSWIKAEGV